MKIYAKYQNGFEYLSDDDIISISEIYGVPISKLYDVIEYLEDNNIYMTPTNLEDIINILK